MPLCLMLAPCKLGKYAHQQAVQCDSALSGTTQLAELPGPSGAQALLMAMPNWTQSLRACSRCKELASRELAQSDMNETRHIYSCVLLQYVASCVCYQDCPSAIVHFHPACVGGFVRSNPRTLFGLLDACYWSQYLGFTQCVAFGYRLT